MYNANSGTYFITESHSKPIDVISSNNRPINAAINETRNKEKSILMTHPYLLIRFFNIHKYLSANRNLICLKGFGASALWT